MPETDFEILRPSNLEDFTFLLGELFKKKQRIQTFYTQIPQTDGRSTLISLESLDEIGKIDKTNSCITFMTGCRVSALLEALKFAYSKEPFSRFPAGECAGHFFTHRRLFGSDTLMSMKIVMPDGKVMRLGSGAFASVAGYNAMDLFLGSRNIVGIPVAFTFKLLPEDSPLNRQRCEIDPVRQDSSLDSEERKILLSLKSIYDPLNLLNIAET
jgi:FAD/FMN-containing dehydrogenase